MVTLEFHDPSGAIEVKQPFAPRITALEGKRIGFVSNDQWQAFRMLPLLKNCSRPTSRASRCADRRLPSGNAVIGSEETAAQVKERRRRVIIGNAHEGPAPLHAAGRPLGSKHRESQPSP